MATDASLAYAHKQRFPSLNLTASLSDSTDRVSDLFSPSSLAWSLLGSISAPIFEGGRLQANEEIARLNTQKQEQQYLQTLYDAFGAEPKRLASGGLLLIKNTIKRAVTTTAAGIIILAVLVFIVVTL